ncbi:MAG: hypothetical protein ACOYOK_01760 [Pseudobdellovibrionaceae bacterium]
MKTFSLRTNILDIFEKIKKKASDVFIKSFFSLNLHQNDFGFEDWQRLEYKAPIKELRHPLDYGRYGGHWKL